jgi:hypothetical protein
MVVEHSRPFVETPCVPRVHEAELLKVEMMTEFVAQGAQERAERCDFLAYRRSHPHPDQHRIRRVISKSSKAPRSRTLNGLAASTRMPQSGTP